MCLAVLSGLEVMVRGLLAELLVLCSVLQHSLVTFSAGATAQDLLHVSLAKSPAKDKGCSS